MSILFNFQVRLAAKMIFNEKQSGHNHFVQCFYIVGKISLLGYYSFPKRIK